MRIAIALVLCGSPLGCTAILGLDAPTRAPDAAVEPPPCPTTYTVTFAVSTTRYRLVTSTAPFAMQHAGCNADQPGRTHLASLDSIAEIDALMSVVPSLTYIGAVQAPSEISLAGGWITFGGGPLPVRWNNNSPNDLDGVENGEQNIASIDPSGIADRTATDSYGAVCECDGIAIDPTALSYLP